MVGKFARLKKTTYLCIRLQANVRDLAQLVAHTSGGREVAGSSPVIPTNARVKVLKISTLTFLIPKFAQHLHNIYLVQPCESPVYKECMHCSEIVLCNIE